MHEFGHSLHGMFANSTYRSLSGTNVYWDFVELPSQIMENFAIEKDFLNTFARHYQTGEVLPDELIKRLVDASNFNIAYACLRQLSFGLLDMAWYTRNTPFEGDVKAYEQEAWKDAQILPIVPEACMSTQFSHIFAGGYAPDTIVINGRKYWMPMLSHCSSKKEYSIRKLQTRSAIISCRKEERNIQWYFINVSADRNQVLMLY